MRRLSLTAATATVAQVPKCNCSRIERRERQNMKRKMTREWQGPKRMKKMHHKESKTEQGAESEEEVSMAPNVTC